MAGVLNFANYLGGADNVQIQQVFPSSQNTFVYNFGQNVLGWTYALEQQTIIADTVTFDRITGEPNFSSSKIIGTFPAGSISASNYVKVVNTASGTVAVTFPGGLYTGPILPDARQNVPITVGSVTWTIPSTPPTINSHRWAFIQSWEPGVTSGDPTLANSYTPISVGV